MRGPAMVSIADGRIESISFSGAQSGAPIELPADATSGQRLVEAAAFKFASSGSDFERALALYVAFALAAVLAPSLPRAWRAVFIALAVTVAFGRVYAGVHLPLDVVGGAGLGLLCGTLARWAFGLGGEGLPVAPVGDEPPP